MYITDKIYNELENSKTKIGKKCFNILNYDLCMIYVDNKVWWLEKTSMYNYIPSYFIEFMKKYLKRKYNLIYLYDLK